MINFLISEAFFSIAGFSFCILYYVSTEIGVYQRILNTYKFRFISQNISVFSIFAFDESINFYLLSWHSYLLGHGLNLVLQLYQIQRTQVHLKVHQWNKKMQISIVFFFGYWCNWKNGQAKRSPIISLQLLASRPFQIELHMHDSYIFGDWK